MLARLLLLAPALLSFVMVGCGDDYGESCSLPASDAIERLCGEVRGDDGTAVQTCVFTNSPECSSRMCAQYAGTSGFCSEPCDPAATDPCGTGSVCLEIPTRADGYCVPLSAIDAQ